MKVGILGSAAVAQSLAAGFLKHGHDVTMGTRDPQKLAEFTGQHPGLKVGSASEAAAFGELLVLAVKGSAASKVLQSAGAANLSGKTILDATNPIADEAPVNGVLKFFTNLDESLMERLQAEFPDAKLVKCFSCVGNAAMVDPKFEGGKPTMFLCGNDDGAKKQAVAILEQFGWEWADMGKAEAARAIEPLCILWCIPGFLTNDWMHAFKLLR